MCFFHAYCFPPPAQSWRWGENLIWGVFLFVISLFFTFLSFANSVFSLVVEAISALHLTVPWLFWTQQANTHLTVSLPSNTVAERVLPSELFFWGHFQEWVRCSMGKIHTSPNEELLLFDICASFEFYLLVPDWHVVPFRVSHLVKSSIIWASAAPEHSKGLWAASNFHRDSQHSPEPLILSNHAPFWRLSPEHSREEIKIILHYCVSQVSFLSSS